MPVPRTPDDLLMQLRRARHLEIAAETPQQERSSIIATSALMLAAVDAGWFTTDIAATVGLKLGTASKRIRDARKRRGDAPSGLVIDTPPEIRGPLAELDTPVEQRDWLSRAEAADYLGVAGRTIQSLYLDGLLPNSRPITTTWRMYLRADLDRVRNGPRRGIYLDRAALRSILTGLDGIDRGTSWLERGSK